MGLCSSQGILIQTLRDTEIMQADMRLMQSAYKWSFCEFADFIAAFRFDILNGKFKQKGMLCLFVRSPNQMTVSDSHSIMHN